MDPQPSCPCCGDSLLRHIRPQGLYWFCPHCYQAMPVLEAQPSPWRQKPVFERKAAAQHPPQTLKQPA